MTHDSDRSATQPSDSDLRPGKPADELAADDETVDLGQRATAGVGGSGVLPGSGPLSGSSVLSWNDLVKQQSAAGADDEDLPVYRGGDVCDPDSDKDLLKQVLADAAAAPPSDVIYKDPSNFEVPALPRSLADRPPAASPPAARAAAEDSAFILPPELIDPRAPAAPEDSAVVGRHPGAGPAPSSHSGDIWVTESSRVDLLGEPPPALPASSLQRTEKIGGEPPILRPPDDPTLLHPYPPGGDDSAVELGSDPEIQLPPLPESSHVRGRRRRPRPVRAKLPPEGPPPDSGTVDLATASSEFELDLDEGQAPPHTAHESDALPTTVPLVPAGRSRWASWLGAGLVGLGTGVAACAGLWYAGLTPDVGGRPLPSVPAPTDGGDAAAAARYRDLADRLREAGIDPGDVPAAGERLARAAADAEAARQARADLERLRDLLQKAGLAATDLAALGERLSQAAAAAEEAKQARSKVEALTEQLRQARLAPEDLQRTIRQLTAARAGAEGRLGAAEAELARTRDELARARAEAQAAAVDLKAQLERVTADHRALAAFVADLTRRMQAARLVPAGATPAQLLAGLDRVLQPQPSAAAPDPVHADRHYTAGVRAYYAGDFAGAERELAEAARMNDRDPRYLYFLGLARWKLGRADAADALRQGAELERQNLLNPGEVDASLERLPMDARRVINNYRR